MSLAHHRYRLLAAVLALFVACPVAPAAGQAPPKHDQARSKAAAPAPCWPLDLPARWLTSNFMEYRGGRFHAGLDFKTRETEGFPAFAVESGWISRVRATPGGYGRAVYLRGASGRTYVYAHLGRFADRIGALVAAAQANDGRYRVELELAAHEMPVARGEVLGLSGQSGTTGPHLHFEVRDEAGRPIDPLAAGFAVRDTIAPVIHHVRAVPASADARLEGEGVARRLPVSGQEWVDGLAPPLHASGPVAFTARIVDATDPGGHRLEPWLIELKVDGNVVYRRANESFDFAENAQQRLEWLEDEAIRDQWLHRAAQVTVAGREGAEWFRGETGHGLAPGVHRFELAAADRAGNRSTVAWDMVTGSRDRRPAGGSQAWVAQEVGIVIRPDPSRRIVLQPLFEILPDDPAPAMLHHLTPDGGGPVLAPLTVVSRPAGLDSTLRRQATVQGLVILGGGVEWRAAAWPVGGAPLFALPEGLGLPAGGAGDAAVPAPAMYRWEGTAWTPAGPVLAPAAAGGPWRFALAQPGLHAAMRDTVPPTIDPGPLAAMPHPGYGAAVAGVTPPRWTILPVGVRDAGAGVDAGSISARWDGRPLVVEPDLLRDRVLVEIPDSTRAGVHALDLEVADGAGRRATRRLEVSCRPGAPPGR